MRRMIVIGVLDPHDTSTMFGLIGDANMFMVHSFVENGGDYVAAIERADLVVSLTEEPTSVMRSGCEAVWAQRPLLVSDSPATREAFQALLGLARRASAGVSGNSREGHANLRGEVRHPVPLRWRKVPSRQRDRPAGRIGRGAREARGDGPDPAPSRRIAATGAT